MNTRLARNLIAILIVVLVLSLMVILAGCTVYTVEKTEDSTKVTVISSRDFEQPELHYKRDEESAEFDFGAASAQTNSSLEVIGAEVVRQLLGRNIPLEEGQ